MKIAIILPEKAIYRDVWRAAKLAELLQFLKGADGAEVEVVIGLPRAADEVWRRGEAEIKAIAPRCIVRHLGWERVATEMALRMYPAIQSDLEGIHEVSIPRDWGWNFTDCDAWIVLADAWHGAVLPLKPTAFYVRDLAARYVPSAFGQDLHAPYWERQTDAFRLWRQSHAVVASSDATLDDLSSYAGVRRSRLIKVPAFRALPVRRVKSERTADPTLLWLVEPDAGYDLANALEGLRIYKAEGGLARILVAGVNAHRLVSSELASELRTVPTWSRKVLECAALEPIAHESDLRRLIQRVDLVWSSALADGENEGLVRASAANLPFIGYRYPQSEMLAEALGVRVSFYNQSTPPEIADALHLASDATSFSGIERDSTLPAPTLPEEWLPVLDRLLR
ncbi:MULTISPECIES: hypothetical protein [unclassified Ensifer]|uniref:hypothetical protein n=1 Tax=unclassified Ensifer TaxID=2633371 RepID=UPI000AC5C5F8|nr:MULTISPECIES: hypothetical protein [unclassified Ensifer]